MNKKLIKTSATFSALFLTILLMAAQCGPEPEITKIVSFTATPPTLPAGGGEVTLAWDVKGADEISIDQDVGVVTGNSKKVTVTKDTTFTLTASKGGQKITSTANVKVETTPTTFIEVLAPNPTAPAKTAKLPVVIEGNYAVYQGDILFPLDLVQGANSGEITAQGNGMKNGHCRPDYYVLTCWDRSYLWPNKTLSYTFDSGVNPTLRAHVYEAARIYQERAGITLIESGAPEDRVLIQEFDPDDDEVAAGSSWVGRTGGEQDIFFQPDAPLRTVIHELGHALGLWHEHARADRDANIRLLEGNIKDDIKDVVLEEFEITDADVGQPYGPYDFYSVMHYGRFLEGVSKSDGAGKSLPIFELVNPSGIVLSKIGTEADLSPGDVLALANLYDTPVTNGDISLLMKGSRKLVNGGSTTINVRIANEGPRPIKDLYFAVWSDKPVTMSGGNGMVCAASGGPAGNPILCYMPTGPAVGTYKDYGPLTVTVPADAPNGEITIELGLKPIGMRLANESDGKSTVKLTQVRVEPDAYEVDNTPAQAKRILANVPQQRTLTASDIDYILMDVFEASETNAYAFDLVAEDTSEPLRTEWTVIASEPSKPVMNCAKGEFITSPGRYYVAVSGSVTRYTAELKRINLTAANAACEEIKNRPYKILVFEIEDPLLDGILIDEFDTVLVTGLEQVKIKSDNLKFEVYDQSGEVYSRGGETLGDVTTIDIPTLDPAGGDSRQFFLKLERVNNTVIEGNLVLEQPSVGYSMVGCAPTQSEVVTLCPNP